MFIRNTIKQVNKQVTDLKKIFAIHISYKALKPRMYKNYRSIRKRQIIHLKMVKRLVQALHK